MDADSSSGNAPIYIYTKLWNLHLLADRLVRTSCARLAASASERQNELIPLKWSCSLVLVQLLLLCSSMTVSMVSVLSDARLRSQQDERMMFGLDERMMFGLIVIQRGSQCPRTSSNIMYSYITGLAVSQSIRE